MSLPGVDQKHPLLLAPLDDITDRTVRRIARRFGADAVVTEFISAEGLIRDAAKSLRKLDLAADEHPVAIQIFGSRIDSVVRAAEVAAAAGPDWVDLNFGCPARKVAGKGGGAGLLLEPEKLEAMTRAVVSAIECPVTAKIRLGWDEQHLNVLEVSQRLEQAGVQFITVHARLRSQGYGVRSDWSWIAKVKRHVSVPIVGNGDVRSPQDAARMFAETGCDAVMIGRAAMGNPWLFKQIRVFLDRGICLPPPDVEERFAVLKEHLREASADKSERRAVIEMRKHYSGYMKGLPMATALRRDLMELYDLAAVEARLDRYAEEVTESPALGAVQGGDPGALRGPASAEGSGTGASEDPSHVESR